VQSLTDAYDLLNDHENYPQAICSNYQTGAQDPAVTCGGAVGDLSSGQVSMWRGDALYDANFVRRDFDLGINRRG
jgi:isopenicillin-N N-acyltransferase like protein